MGKVELCGLSWHVASMAFGDLVDCDSKRRVIEGWTPIVEVVGIRSSCSACIGDKSQQLKHFESKLIPSLLVWGTASTHGINAAQ